MIIEKLQRQDLPQLFALYQELVPFEMTLDKLLATHTDIEDNPAYFLAAAKEEEQLLGSALGICCQSLAVPFLVIEDVIVTESEKLIWLEHSF